LDLHENFTTDVSLYNEYTHPNLRIFKVLFNIAVECHFFHSLAHVSGRTDL